MKYILIILLQLLHVASFSQKNYQVNSAIWSYAPPADYKIRVDNFLSIAKTGDSAIRANSKNKVNIEESVVLLAVAKSDSINMNMIIADYQSNANILKFTLKGYIPKFVEFLEYNYAKIGSDALLTTRVVTIDNLNFYVIEGKMYHKDKDYTYWNAMYITELGDKEFSISTIYDNEIDRKIIEESILKSKFKTK